MMFSNTCLTIRDWCERSNGKPIKLPSGDNFSFIQKKRYSDDEIDSFEQKNLISLPQHYRKFLKIVGASSLFIDENKLGFEFVGLDELEQFSFDVFENFGLNFFPKLLLVVALTRIGDFGGFVLERPDEEKFNIFPHDEDPDEWRDILVGWSSFDAWIIMLVESEGRKSLS
ncbi:SMI1/KNR4 family protein, partial [Undibacterium flavidum]